MARRIRAEQKDTETPMEDVSWDAQNARIAPLLSRDQQTDQGPWVGVETDSERPDSVVALQQLHGVAVLERNVGIVVALENRTDTAPGGEARRTRAFFLMEHRLYETL